jgi:hypothetical protein
VQRFGDKPADGSLARAHETDEREIDDAAVALHSTSFKFQAPCFKRQIFFALIPVLVIENLSGMGMLCAARQFAVCA